MPAASHAQAVPPIIPFGQFEISLDVVTFKQSDVLSVTTEEGADGAEMVIVLAPHLAEAFAKVTRDRPGYDVTLLICGIVAFRAEILDEMTGAEIRYSTMDTASVKNAMDLMRDPPCANMS